MKRLCLILFGIICSILLSACGVSNPPNETQIISDLQESSFEYYREIENVEPSFTLVDTITNLEIAKRQTNDKEDTVWCIVQLENDTYRFTTYNICYYNYYDKGGWILDGIESYQSDEYELKNNPLKQESIFNSLSSQYSDVVIDSIDENLTNNVIQCRYTCTERYKYYYVKYNRLVSFYFNGRTWQTSDEEISQNTLWDIVGEWTIESPKYNSKYFSLNITNFDQENLKISGTCHMYNDYSGDVEFDLADATIDLDYYDPDDLSNSLSNSSKNNHKCLNICLMGTNDYYVRFFSDYGKAAMRLWWIHRIQR